MSKNMKYEEIDHKQVKIIFNDKSLIFQLASKRGYTVLIELLKNYPEHIDIHKSLDKTFGDPNRAHSDLRNTDGFGIFLNEKKGNKRVMQLRIDIEKIFEVYKSHPETEIISTSTFTRNNLSDVDKNKIYKFFNGHCNITGITLHDKIENNQFMKNFQVVNYDHRKPLFKGGKDELENFQILSEIVNREKNKICVSCEVDECNTCALAFPEKNNIIKANNQSINEIISAYSVKKSHETEE